MMSVMRDYEMCSARLDNHGPQAVESNQTLTAHRKKGQG